MIFTPLCLKDIQTSELLYYDLDFEDICFRFCQERDIDCLPSLNDPLIFYRKAESNFREEAVMPEMMVGIGANIFERALLDRFRENYVLFVYKKGVLMDAVELSGVVHFSDYERALRRLLVLHSLSNQDMLDYFQSVVEVTTKEKTREIFQGKINAFEANRARYDKLPPFERFYLLDFIELARLQEIISLSQEVNDLRNMVMHAHELISRDDACRDDYIYNFSSFETFFNRVSKLLEDYKKVNNKIAFLELA